MGLGKRIYNHYGCLLYSMPVFSLGAAERGYRHGSLEQIGPRHGPRQDRPHHRGSSPDWQGGAAREGDKFLMSRLSMLVLACAIAAMSLMTGRAAGAAAWKAYAGESEIRPIAESRIDHDPGSPENSRTKHNDTSTYPNATFLNVKGSGGQSRPIEILIGLDFDAMKSLLGTPAKLEVRSAAMVWFYRGYDCVLSIFFFAPIGGGKSRALAYEVSASEDIEKDPQHCFFEVLEGSGKLSGGGNE